MPALLRRAHLLCGLLLLTPLTGRAEPTAAETAAPSTDPAHILHDLAQPERRGAALKALQRPSAPLLSWAQDQPQIGAQLAQIAQDHRVPLEDRLRALRAIGLYAAPPEALTGLLMGRADDPEQQALGREAALAIVLLKGSELLRPALTHADPELRATALRAVGDLEAACAALGVNAPSADPWPSVRRAAARALRAAQTPLGCMLAALEDDDLQVRRHALEAIGAQHAPQLRPTLRRLAAEATADVQLRALAVGALAQLGDLEPTAQILRTHLEQGGIEGLVQGAIRALLVSESPTAEAELVTLIEKSASFAVRLHALQALAAVSAPRSEALFTQLFAASSGPQRQALLQLGERQGWPTGEPELDEPGEEDEPD